MLGDDTASTELPKRRATARTLKTWPLDAAVERFLDEARHSDLGSSGGNVMFAVLGDEPEHAASMIARLAHNQLVASHVDPGALSRDRAMCLLSGAQMLFMMECGGVPGATLRRDEPFSSPPPSCRVANAEDILKREGARWIAACRAR